MEYDCSPSSPSRGDRGQKHHASQLEAPSGQNHDVEVTAPGGYQSPFDLRVPILAQCSGAESIERSVFAPRWDVSELGVDRRRLIGERHIELEIILEGEETKERALPLAGRLTDNENP